jgi:ATP/ADP translocase
MAPMTSEKGVATVNKGLIVLLILLAIALNVIAFVGFGPAFSTYLRSCQSSISNSYPTSCSTTASSAVVIGFVLYLGGVIAAIIAWIVGVITTARMRRWGWFVAVLILPVLGSLLYGLFGPATKPQY